MATKKQSNLTIGVILIILGVLFLLNNLDVIYVHDWWPIFLLLVGAAFFFGWVADRRQTGLLMPAGILITLGAQFLFIHSSWPIYVLAPAIGFWLMYLLGESHLGLLIPALILTIIAVAGWFQETIFSDLWPVLFIIFGVILILMGRRRKEKAPDIPEFEEKPETPSGGEKQENDTV